MSRWVGFFITLILGAAAGLYYAWVIDPVEYVDTSPDLLLVDYRVDYVLMVAEAYTLEGDLNLAIQRLAVLGSEPPQETVNTAILFARRNGYMDADLAQMRQLEQALATLPAQNNNDAQPASGEFSTP
jgi:hypothetical protein